MTVFNLVNFRQLGGLETKDGKKLKSNRLLRSGELVGLTGKTVNELKDTYDLVKIIDLRGKQEITERPDDDLEDVHYEWIDIMKNFDNLGASMEGIAHLSAAEAAAKGMTLFYQTVIRNQGSQEGYRQYFDELLTTEEGSVLFHCFAGKDRTGIAAALTLELLDVPRETIYKDYLLTNPMRKAANELLLAEAKQAGKSAEELAGMEVGLSVQKQYLEAAYDTIETEFGSVHEYAKDALGVGSSEVKALKRLYVD